MDQARTRSPRKALPRFEDLPDEALVRAPQLIPSPLPISVVTLWKWRTSGKFPPGEVINGTRMWRVRTVREWLRRQEAA